MASMNTIKSLLPMHVLNLSFDLTLVAVPSDYLCVGADNWRDWMSQSNSKNHSFTSNYILHLSELKKNFSKLVSDCSPLSVVC
mgnify:CR=1 FL=1